LTENPINGNHVYNHVVPKMFENKSGPIWSKIWYRTEIFAEQNRKFGQKLKSIYQKKIGKKHRKYRILGNKSNIWFK